MHLCSNQPFYCETCTCGSIKCSVAVDQNNQNVSILSELINDEASLDATTISLNNTDFDFESDDENLDSRGLNFDVLPFDSNLIASRQYNFLPKRTRVYKYPCLVCHSVCSNNQNCICCTLCDEWVHLKCTDLTVSKFNK